MLIMKKFHLKKRHKILLEILLFVVIILFTIPRAGRLYIVKHSPELVGRRLDIKKIRINYFTGTLSVYGVKLYESDSKTVFLSLNLFRINLDYLPLFKNEIFVKYVSLDDPFIQVLQNGDKFNFSDLTATDTTVTVKDTIPSAPTKYIINNIQINRGYVKYTDLQLNHTIALDRLDLAIPGFIWNNDSTNLNVNFRFVDGGGLSSSFEMNQADSTYSLNLKLDSLNLNIIEPYIKSYLHISSLHGYLSNDILIKGNMSSIMQLFIKGINHVYNFQLVDTLNRTLLSFKDLSVDIDTLQLDKNKYRLKAINLTDPFILYEMIDSTNNWLALMKPSISQQPDSLHQVPDTSALKDEVIYSFSKLTILDGKVLISDKTLRYPFDYNIDNIMIESTPIAGKPGVLSSKMKAGLNGTGSFIADAILNPDNFSDLDLDLSIGQFRMKDLDAYFKHYFGFPVTAGILNFKTEDKIRTESLVSNNSIYFRKFTLNKSIGGKVEYHIPLRLALAILSDKDGIIDLKAPVESKGKDVKVRNLGKIIFRTIGNLFVKAAVSPINLLSASYKVDPETLQEIRLGFLEPSPDEKNLKSVDIIADILNKKPGLNVDFYYCINRQEAIDSLAYMMTIEDYLKYNNNSNIRVKNVEDSTLVKYLLTRLPSETVTPAPELKILCRNYIGADKINAKLDSLQTLQSGFLKNYLGTDKEISADRFIIIPIAPDTIRPKGKYPSFRTYFTAAGDKQE
jgi:hypothetical protein